MGVTEPSVFQAQDSSDLFKVVDPRQWSLLVWGVSPTAASPLEAGHCLLVAQLSPGLQASSVQDRGMFLWWALWCVLAVGALGLENCKGACLSTW